MHFTDEQPFLDAIFDRYADDRPRLVYADYLDDAGEAERAELIRVQIALARLTKDDPRRAPLSERQAELLTHNRAAWTADLAGLVVGIDFRRGIPDSASVDAATFVERGYELFRRLHIRRLRLLDAAPALEKLFASPLLESVRELDLCNAELGNPGVARLAQSPYFKELESLDLGFNGIDDTGVIALARASTFPNLTALALNDNDSITSEGVGALAESPFFAGLTSLDIAGNDICDAGIAALANSPAMGRLRNFRVNNNRIGDAGVTALAKSSLFARMLEAEPRLELRANGIGPAGAAVLAACPTLARCSSLDLTSNYLGDAGVNALLGSPYLTNLKVLRLGRNQLTDGGVASASHLFHALFDHLQLLDISHNRLTRLGMSILSTVRGSRAVPVEIDGNVQSGSAGDAPVAVRDLMPDVMEAVAEAARLKRQIANPRHRNENG